MPEQHIPDTAEQPAQPPSLDALSLDVEAVMSSLDLASGELQRRLQELQRAPAPTPSVPAPAAPEPAEPSQDAENALERRMREAEQEARDYLEQAKRRADRIVASTIGAADRDAAEARREAEEGVRRRWEQIELEGRRHLDEAERVSTRMVFERHRQITELSDGIATRALALTAGMDDAERIRNRFDTFVRALSTTADRVAVGDPATGDDAEPSGLPSRTGTVDGALAA